MERKFYTMKNQKTKNEFGLLPNYFKKIGIVIMLLSVIPAIMIKALHIKLGVTSKEFLKLLTINIFILGLLFIAWSKDKIEDEMTVALRLKSMGFAFIWAIFYVIIAPFVNILVNYPTDITGQSLVLSMLLVYLFMYYVQKKGR